MLVSLIGLFIVVVVGLVILSGVAERSLWSGVWPAWRLMFPGYREAAAMKGIADKLKVYSDGQDRVIETMRQARETLIVEMTKAHELNRTLDYRVFELENVVAQLDAYSMIEIQGRLKGNPVRKRVSKLKAAAMRYKNMKGMK